MHGVVVSFLLLVVPEVYYTTGASTSCGDSLLLWVSSDPRYPEILGILWIWGKVLIWCLYRSR